MEIKKNKRKKTVTTFDQLIESRHGKIGTKKGLILKSKPNLLQLEK